MGHKVNWGVISCAGIAESTTIPAIMKAENAHLYAISGKTPEKLDRFAQKFMPDKVYNDYEAMLQDPNVHAVYIPLPNSLHYTWAAKAAAYKKHVLCEKPLALNADEVRDLIKVCDDNGVLLMEAFASRHNPVLIRIKEFLDEGAIGKVKYIEAHFSFSLKDRNNIRWIKELGGGATYDVGAYTLGTIRYLMGKEPIRIHASGEVDQVAGVDLSSVTTMTFDDGAMATSYCGFNSSYWDGYTIIGDGGRIDAPVNYNGEGQVSFNILTEGDLETVTIDVPNNYLLEIEQFGRCILENEKPLVSHEDSLGNAVVIDKILASIL